MLAADVAEVVLPEVCYDFAKPALVEVGASLTIAELEVRRVMRGYAGVDDVPVSAVEASVFFKGGFVNVNFPADAAAVIAFVGNASEFFVIAGGVEFHGRSFCVVVVDVFCVRTVFFAIGMSGFVQGVQMKLHIIGSQFCLRQAYICRICRHTVRLHFVSNSLRK